MSDLIYEQATTPVDKPKRSIWPIILSILAILVIILCVIWTFFGRTIRDYFVGMDYEPSPEMASSIEKLKLTWRGNLIARASRPVYESAELFNDNCPDASESTSTLGCYLPSERTIHIYDIHSDELNGIKESILAHELLHAIYDRLGSIERGELNEALDDYFNSRKEVFGEYIKAYEKNQYYTELHSIIGQRVHYKDLPDVLRKHYSKYFYDQDAVVAFYDQYHEVIDDLNDQMNSLKAEIDEMYAALEQERQDYRDYLDQYNADVAYHNEQTEQGNYIEERYQELKKRSGILDQKLTSLNNSINKYNEKATAYNELLERQRQLYGRMNSKSVIKPEKAE